MSIKKNQIVTMKYELKVGDDLIESNLKAEPIEFTFGRGELLDGLEDRMVNMNAGEIKDIKVPAIEAYGEYDNTLAETLPIEEFEGIDLEIGLILEADDENGDLIKATVTEVTKDNVTVDYNHPLAGKDLDFKVVVEKIS